MSSVATHWSIEIFWNSIDGLLMVDSFFKDTPHRRAADLKAPSNLGFGNASTMQFSNLSCVKTCAHRSTKPFAVLPSVR